MEAEKKSISAKEASLDDAACVDDVPDADGARKEVDEAPAEEGKVQDTDTEPSKAATCGRASSAATATKLTGSQEKDRTLKGGEADRKAVIANLQANASESDKVDREAIVANLRSNTKTMPRKSVTRSVSANHTRKPAAKELEVVDRAAIRAALTGKMAEDPEKIAREKADLAKQQAEEAEILKEQRALQRETEREKRKEEIERQKEEREEQRKIRAEQRAWDQKRREDARKAIEAAANVKALSMADLEKIRAQNQFVERFNGMSEQTQKYDFDPTAPRGPSQTVTYTSRFVDRLSDVLDDLSVSGSLSIKAGKIGGSGMGSFVDSDKFKERSVALALKSHSSRH